MTERDPSFIREVPAELVDQFDLPSVRGGLVRDLPSIR
jgi:hypothetical protein